jgi:hypothetical protein
VKTIVEPPTFEDDDCFFGYIVFIDDAIIEK